MAVRFKKLSRSVCRLLIAVILSLSLSGSLSGCASQSRQIRLVELPDIPSGNEVRKLSGPISEVAPPAIFLDLAKLSADQQPQVAIASPQPNQTIEDTHIEVQLDLQNFSIYKDKDLALGPHIQLILDNQPARSIYSIEEPIVFADLAPGSHTLRAIAVQPWGESFKNETAYAQTSFHVFAPTGENSPDPDLPLLTFIEPQGTFSAEPLLLDFYLTNAPLHFLAQSDDELPDWKIRAAVNGRSFVFDQWQPIYLKGFEPGKSWIQLTLINDQGQPIENAFNSTVRIIDYDPDKQDSLAKLVRGELPLDQAGKIVDPNYQPPAEVPAEEVLPVEEALSDEPAAFKTDEAGTDELKVNAIEAEKRETEALQAEAERARLEQLKTEELEELETKELKTEETEEIKTEELETEAIDATELEAKTLEEPEIQDPIQDPQIEPAYSTDTEIEPIEAEENGPGRLTEQETASPKKKSLFGRFFGKQAPAQQSPPIAEPVTEPSSTGLDPALTAPSGLEPELPALPSELDIPADSELTDPDNAPVLLPSEADQLEVEQLEVEQAKPTDIDPVLEELVEEPEIPTALSSPDEIEDVELERDELKR